MPESWMVTCWPCTARQSPVRLTVQARQHLAFLHAGRRQVGATRHHPDVAEAAHRDAVAPLAERQPDELRVHGDLVFLAGKRYSLKENDLVFAAPAPGGGTDLIILTRSAPRLKGLGSRLGHYGKYSWLLFAGSGRQVVKGNWTPQGSPLVVDLQP